MEFSCEKGFAYDCFYDGIGRMALALIRMVNSDCWLVVEYQWLLVL